MKRKLLTLLIVIGGFAMSACQEDSTMDELIQDTELNTAMDPDDDKDEKNEGSPGSN
ncbi:MAG: hypothetical protein AB8B73_11410 [Ekhidna sp.]